MLKSIYAWAVVSFSLIVLASLYVTADLVRSQLVEIGHVLEQAIAFSLTALSTDGTSFVDVLCPWTCAKAVAILLACYGYYILQIRPLNRVRKLGDVGYIPEGGFSMKETANLVQRQRKVGNVPPPFPNGWFALLESAFLKKGEVKPVTALGENFAVFRDENGAAHAVNAYCPHLGANIAVGGRVIGDCIECPFHAWLFRGEDGKCVRIHYTEKIPEKAGIKRWPSREVSGWIFVWHHSEGCDPTWVIPVVEELELGAWVYRGRTEHFINAHIQEISENGADVNHLNQVHGPVIAAGANLRTMWSSLWAFAGHEWTAAWEQCPEPNGHVGSLRLTHTLSLFGFQFSFFKLAVTARQFGPGFVYLEFNGFFGRGMFMLTSTPQGPLCQRVVHTIHANRWMPAIIAKVYMMSEAIQLERDIMIWNNKQFEARPLFVKSQQDTLLARHRRWYAQFYSHNSYKLFQKEDLSF